MPGHIPSSRYSFELQRVRLETQVYALRKDVDWRDLRMIRESDGLAHVTELLESDAGAEAGIGRVNPVVEAVERRIDAKLGVYFSKTREHHLAGISSPVAVGVLKVQNVGALATRTPFFHGSTP